MTVNFEAHIGATTELAIDDEQTFRFFFQIRPRLQELRFGRCIVEGNQLLACNLFQLLDFHLRLHKDDHWAISTLVPDLVFYESPMLSAILSDFDVVRDQACALAEVAQHDSVVVELIGFHSEELEDDILHVLGHCRCEEIRVFHHNVPKAQQFFGRFVVELTACQNTLVSFIDNEVRILLVLLDRFLHVQDDEILSALAEHIFHLLDEIRVGGHDGTRCAFHSQHTGQQHSHPAFARAWRKDIDVHVVLIVQSVSYHISLEASTDVILAFSFQDRRDLENFFELSFNVISFG